MSWIKTGGSICFTPYTIEQALRGLAEAGFENVELGAVTEYHKHLDPDALGPAEINTARVLLEHFGLRCVSVSGHAQLHTVLGAQRLDRVLTACAELGAGVLNTFTGDAEDAAQRAQFIVNVRALADRAQALGVRLCIENDSTLMPTAAIGLELLDEIGHDWIEINYDPANVIYHAGVSPETDWPYALRRLGHVHLKDKRGGRGVASFPPLGEGELDVAGFMRALGKAGFAGPVSMEIEFDDFVWPSWEQCVAAATKGRKYWDSVMSELDTQPAQ